MIIVSEMTGIKEPNMKMFASEVATVLQYRLQDSLNEALAMGRLGSELI
jgi:hypothetical protein